jgi:hypothetical protein
MKSLKEFFEVIREFYEDGIGMINEFWAQIAHVTSIISALIFLWVIAPKNVAGLWFLLFTIYICLLATCGFVKFNILDDNPALLIVYIVGTVGLAIVGAVATGILRTVMIVGFVALVTCILWKAGYALNSITLSRSRKKPFFERLYNKNPKTFILTYVAILVLVMWIPVMILSVNLLLKIFIIAGYILIIPIVSRLADEGIDIESLFD